MTIRKITFAPGEYYHIYSRGVDKRVIFLDDRDRQRFVRLLYLCNSNIPVVYKTTQNLPLEKIILGEKLAAIGAYCLMPNHFHILLKETKEGGLVKLMSKLLTAYSTYFNKKYERIGSLFSSEFKSSHLDTDEYLKYIFAYIHMNPLKLVEPHWREKVLNKSIVGKFLKQYPYSSYAEYIGQDREERLILTREVFPEYFQSIREFENYIFDWLNFSEPLSKPSPWIERMP